VHTSSNTGIVACLLADHCVPDHPLVPSTSRWWDHTMCDPPAMAGPANAAATTFKDHKTAIPGAGDVFHCTPVDLTVASGTIDSYFNGVQDAQGVFHVTGTIVAHDVTLTDGRAPATSRVRTGSDPQAPTPRTG
jgi:hypothetical protein